MKSRCSTMSTYQDTLQSTTTKIFKPIECNLRHRYMQQKIVELSSKSKNGCRSGYFIDFTLNNWIERRGLESKCVESKEAGRDNCVTIHNHTSASGVCQPSDVKRVWTQTSGAPRVLVTPLFNI
eukprot:scaffold18137_cov143-Skeletonema_dohrnii-CCMP3373.AAC.1